MRSKATLTPSAAAGETDLVTGEYDVVLENHDSTRTLAVRATTTWPEFPRLWPVLLDQVWSQLAAAGISSGCPNFMLYRDNTPRVEVGVIYDGDLALTDPVVVSSLPAGQVATTTHRGAYSKLGYAHQSVVDWCGKHGLPLSGLRWEIYGPHSPDPTQARTHIGWLLSETAKTPQ
jgi:effector-binding domain-containing protein